MNRYTINENQIKCPGCGYEFKDSWEQPDEGNYECDCGIDFHFSRDVEVTYSTEEITKVEADKAVKGV